MRLNMMIDTAGVKMEKVLCSGDISMSRCADSIVIYWIEFYDLFGTLLAYGDIVSGGVRGVDDGHASNGIVKWLCRGCGNRCEGDGYFEVGESSYSNIIRKGEEVVIGEPTW